MYSLYKDSTFFGDYLVLVWLLRCVFANFGPCVFVLRVFVRIRMRMYLYVYVYMWRI